MGRTSILPDETSSLRWGHMPDHYTRRKQVTRGPSLNDTGIFSDNPIAVTPIAQAFQQNNDDSGHILHWDTIFHHLQPMLANRDILPASTKGKYGRKCKPCTGKRQ
jgi:hypothetical protein